MKEKDEIVITAKIDGFRRAGMAHPARPVRHPVDRFSADQLQALREDPRLVVEIVSGNQDFAPAGKIAAGEEKKPAPATKTTTKGRGKA